MSFVKSFTVKGVTYNVEMASAISQDEVQSLLTSPIYERALVCSQTGVNMDLDVLRAMFEGMPSHIKKEVVARILHKAVIHGEKNTVSVEDFRGRMVAYNTLLAHVLEWNLGDFFESLPSVQEGGRAAMTGRGDLETQ